VSDQPRRVAVVAHQAKRLEGREPAALRNALRSAGVKDPMWFEVPKSKKAPARVRRALDDGAELVIAWGGDGMVQRCADAMAGAKAELAIMPAGTANLLASNLGIPKTIDGALDVGLRGKTRKLDLGRVNGEHFAVMAGAGFDSLMIEAAGRGMKDRLGRLAYVWTGAKAVRAGQVGMTVDVDGQRWFDGDASCVLLGNVGTVTGGLRAFKDAEPDDGLLEVGVATADGTVQWARVMTRMAMGRSDRSPFVQMTRGRKVVVQLEHKLPYELDGGGRPATKRLKAKIEPAAIAVRVPEVAA
jgi:YegS/Rv2252/BmrU family lipid kinase